MKHAGGRPRTGTIEMRGSTWHARVTVDGGRKWVNLNTADRELALEKLPGVVKSAQRGYIVSPITTHDDFKRFKSQMEAYEALSARIAKLEELVEQLTN